MMMPSLRSYEDLRQYLANLVNFGGSEGEYDLVGITTLALALLDNLRTHAIPIDIETVCDCMTSDQASYVIKLADTLRSRRTENSD